jgi:hypothetical protein
MCVHPLMGQKLIKLSFIPLYIDLIHTLKISQILHKIEKMK